MNTLIELSNTGTDVTAPGEKSPGKIILRCQAPSDQEKLLTVCPIDRQRNFVGSWDGFNFVLVEVRDFNPAEKSDPETEALTAEIATLKSLTDAKLKTTAAQRGVAWDDKASRETMLELIAKAKK